MTKLLFVACALLFIIALSMHEYIAVHRELDGYTPEQKREAIRAWWDGFIRGGLLYWPPATVMVLLLWLYKIYFK